VWRISRGDGESLVFELADDGAGIPAAVRSRLFQPFATFGKQGGTGLGLAMARRIVEAHGGTIGAASEDGAGTTFRIELPSEPLRRTPIL
jgi:signal transduction histidine kinase